MDIASCYKRGLIPPFFFDACKTNGVDLAVEYAKETRVKIGWAIPMGIIFVVVGVTMFLLCTFDSGGQHKVSELVEVLITSCAIVGMGWFLIAMQLRSTGSEEGNGHKCLASIGDLFTAFQIEPSRAIASMSREEFRESVIEVCLAEQARLANAAGGYDKLCKRKRFVYMHTIALEWGLCGESQDRYLYPDYYPDAQSGRGCRKQFRLKVR